MTNMSPNASFVGVTVVGGGVRRPRRCASLSSHHHHLMWSKVSWVLVLVLTLMQVARPTSAVDTPDAWNACTLALEETDHARNTTVDVDTLFVWCLSDTTCARAYHLDAARSNSRGVFGHLVPDTLTSGTLYTPLAALVCSTDTRTAAQRVWVLLLLAHRRSQQPLCEIDHEFLFDEDTGQQSCVCLPDRPCQQGTSDSTYLYIVFALLAVVSIAVFVSNVIANSALVRTLSRITGDESAGLRALVAAARG